MRCAGAPNLISDLLTSATVPHTSPPPLSTSPSFLSIPFRASPSDMSRDAWITMWIIFFSVVPMIRGVVDPDVCLFGATTLLLLRGIITPRDAFSGLANDSIVSIALMMMIAAGLESSGALEFVPELVLGRSRREWVGQVGAGWLTGRVGGECIEAPLERALCLWSLDLGRKDLGKRAWCAIGQAEYMA